MRKLFTRFTLSFIIIIFSTEISISLAQSKPVSPDASEEAKALLNLIYDISGKYIYTGQHNYPNTRDINSQYARKYIGKTPIVWSTDMGHAEDGDTDSYLARPDIVEEAIRQHHLGSLITICWHAVPPTADEPVTFQPRPDSSPDSLASVQGRLLEEQYKDLLTPGTKIYNRWVSQIDSVAYYLKKLKEAKIPILWRPYHEMNGDWFWWGGRTGEYSTIDIYKQLFDRLVNYHKLDNLVWVWSVDRVHQPKMNYNHYYPGNDYLDILSLDVYGGDFSQDYYDSLVSYSDGKPLVLGEVGNPPSLEIFDIQPKWAFWVVWAGMVRNTSKKQYDIYDKDPRILFREDEDYFKSVELYRELCELPKLPMPLGTINISGKWIFNEEASKLDNEGSSNIPYKLDVSQQDYVLKIKRSFIVEWAEEDRVVEEDYTIADLEQSSTVWNSPKITTVKWNTQGDSLIINSAIKFNRGGQLSEISIDETMTLKNDGDILEIKQVADSWRGKRNLTIVYDREIPNKIDGVLDD